MPNIMSSRVESVLVPDSPLTVETRKVKISRQSITSDSRASLLFFCGLVIYFRSNVDDVSHGAYHKLVR